MAVVFEPTDPKRVHLPVEALFGFELKETNPHEHHEHEHYASWSFVSEAIVTREQVQSFVNALGPEIIRCKGFLRASETQSYEVQVVGLRNEITLHDRQISNSRVIAIGLQGTVNTADLDRLAHSFLTD